MKIIVRNYVRDCGGQCGCAECADRRGRAYRRDAGEELVGKLVKFPVNTLRGVEKQAGVVKRVMPDGRLEIKAQLGGYYLVRPEDLIK